MLEEYGPRDRRCEGAVDQWMDAMDEEGEEGDQS